MLYILRSAFLTFLILFSSNNLLAQNKKSIILALQDSLDNAVKENESLINVYKSKEKDFEKNIKILEKKNVDLNIVLNSSLKNVSSLEIKLDSLLRYKNQLENDYKILKSDYNNISNVLYKRKIIWTGEDSLEIGPFEFFTTALFEGKVGGGMGHSIVFKVYRPGIITTTEELWFDYHSINYENSQTSKHNDNNMISLNGFDLFDVLEINFPPHFSRKIERGKSYKIIYAFDRDDELARSKKGLAGCILEGDVIIDIVPIGGKFERQLQIN
jgi:hypothetical protein